ncbi:virulence factor SrfB [Flavobacterium facile]|uniref:virulence factor SrfB n=1 Tax=Flavobacterium facile TaxID=2893174 RepID=UPI002E7599B3|nr:virulence factor SrfB [Flavobacterium sp. T-12]
MKRISLISNTSIQYIKFEATIDLEFSKINKVHFHEPLDTNISNFIFDPLYKVSKEGNECFYKKEDLIKNNYLINEILREDADLSSLEEINSNFTVNNLKKVLKHYKKKWIPLPFFKDNSINKNILYPTDWIRVYIDTDEEYNNAKIILAIDTTTAKNSFDKTSPSLSQNPEENIFKLNAKEIELRDFLFTPQNNWLDKYLAEVYYGNNEDLKLEKPYKQYIANYVLLCKWLFSLKDLPEIQLFTDDSKKIEVDLVVDLGNSASCALLFENNEATSFQFDKVKKLKIQSFTNPHLEYENSFPMNIIFCESNFGNFKNTNYHNDKFKIPSLVRIGYEAQDIINEASINLNHGKEIISYNSSPKRYLWDKQTANFEWEFYPFKNKTIKKVYLPGISEQLNTKGDLINKNEVFGAKSLYSKNSLMKFVFLEILIHAYVQINSFKFRQEHGNLTRPRTLKRITISCPTGMIQEEQIELRKAAQDACMLLNNYVKYYFEEENNKFWFEMPEIIPSIKDLEKKLSQQEERKDWNYDESTSCQLVFLYDLLSNKLKNHKYVIENYLLNKNNSLTIGSIDIGAGTSDLMINTYDFSFNDKVKATPKPLFWESFKLAGDDLLKEVIQRIIIEGTIQNENDNGTCGVIENHAKSIGIENINEKLNGFFGQNTNNIGLVARLMRKNFINQVAIPIAYYYLTNSNEKSNNQFVKFEDILGKEFKNKELLDYFEKYFGFSFLDIKWNTNNAKVNEIISSVFDGLVKQVALILNQYNCDYIILSGKPCSSNVLEALFMKYLDCSPNKLINLNHIWIGKWFPFADDNGNMKDAKTVVSVGAIIALMSGKLKKMNDFELNIEYLKNNIISTADNILKVSNYSNEVILSSKKNDVTININKIPEYFGYSKFNSKNYPLFNLNCLSFNDDEILKILKNRNPNKENAYYLNELNVEKNKILQNLPLKINIVRDFDESKESLKIESIEDSEGNDKPVKYLNFTYQTLKDEKGYWLDTCEFILNVN